MGSKYTPAQKAATEKYLANNTDRITLRMPKGYKDIWTQAAQAANMSLTQYIMAAVEAQIQQEPEH